MGCFPHRYMTDHWVIAAMSMDFRHEARRALARAKEELAVQGEQRLRYAALELRMSMEGLTYARANQLKDEIPPENYKTWQPRKLMQLLEGIEPNAFKSSTLAFGEQVELGKPAPVMHTLGTECVLTFAEVKDHYDALGSYLHLPTVKQAEKNEPVDFSKLRSRCDELVAVLENVFASAVWNIDFKFISQIDCFRCGKAIVRRISPDVEERICACFECGAEYRVTHRSDQETFWDPLSKEYPCQSEGCGSKILIWRDEIKPGTCWKCEGCGKPYKIGLAVVPDTEQT